MNNYPIFLKKNPYLQNTKCSLKLRFHRQDTHQYRQKLVICIGTYRSTHLQTVNSFFEQNFFFAKISLRHRLSTPVTYFDAKDQKKIIQKIDLLAIPKICNFFFESWASVSFGSLW